MRKFIVRVAALAALLLAVPSLAALTVVSPAVASAANCNASCVQIKKLKGQVRTYKRQAATYKREAATYKRKATALGGQVAALGGEVAALHAPSALPTLIGAVVLAADFKSYVLDPAAARWRTLGLGSECAQYEQVGSSWLYRFWSPDEC
jgi:hypothetical protein